MLFHLLWLSQVLPLPGEGAAFVPGAPQMVCMPWGWHMAGLCLAIHPSLSIVNFCAVYVHPTQSTWEPAGQAGWLLPWSKVLSLPRPVGACPLGPGELHTHVGFRELFFYLPAAILRKMDRDLHCSKTRAPKSTPVYKCHAILQPAKGRYCINAPICLTGLSLPLHGAT